MLQECNFQKYRDIIIPPYCVQVEKGLISSIKPLPDENWEPIIIFGKCIQIQFIGNN